MIKKLYKIIEKPSISFEGLFEKDVVIHSFDIDCSLLKKPEYQHYFDVYDEIQMLSLVTSLNKIANPCIYWFEVENEIIASQEMIFLERFRATKSGRTLPAKNKNFESNCIYVGIRKGHIDRKGASHIAGRTAIHFGYYKVPSTQGLQLVYWAKNKYQLNVMELPKESEMYLNVLEKELAKKLKPLCGRH